MCVCVLHLSRISSPLARTEEFVPSQEEAKGLPSRTKMQARIAMSAPLLRLTGRT